MTATLGNISDTAHWVAYYRAMETARRDAIFRDPFAERLAGPQGAAIVANLRRGRSTAWAMIVRTAVFDEIIMAQVREQGCDLVLNLAAGLDARPWRLPLPPELRWIDVDLPGILDYKLAQLEHDRPVCHYEAVRADLTQPGELAELLARVAPTARRILVISEGLLVYLTPEAVRALAQTLSGAPSIQWWLIDLASPRLLRYLQKRWGKTLERANAPFRFGPAEGTRFFEPCGWHEASFRSVAEEAHRLKRETRMMWFWRLVGALASAQRRAEFRRMAGYVLLARQPVPTVSGAPAR